jgi:hypothetical protein
LSTILPVTAAKSLKTALWHHKGLFYLLNRTAEANNLPAQRQDAQISQACRPTVAQP